MDDYLEYLSLVYFKNVGSNYSLLELSEMLGLQTHQMEELISELIEKKFLEYKDYLLQISQYGKLHLISNNSYFFKLQEEECDYSNIHTPSMSLLDPYVPKKFSKKIKK